MRQSCYSVAGLDDDVVIRNIDVFTDHFRIIVGVDVVIHTAARAHITKDELTDYLKEYRRVNVNGTLNLARQATEAGVNCFILLAQSA